MLVIEAKQGDLQKGFNQLAVELAALNARDDDLPEQRIYGAVSTGDVWAEKRVIADLNTYSVPTNLGEVVSILVAVLLD